MLELCPKCGSFVSTLCVDTGWCRECSKEQHNAVEQFLSANADHLEYFMLQGESLYQAIDSLYSDNQTHRSCASCGALIRRGGRHSIFCRKTPQCRRLVRKYVYLYERKGYTKPEALAEVLQEINGSE